MYRMFELTGKAPWDEYWDELEPMQKLWLYEAWVAKDENELEKDKALAILIGSFSNPEAAKKIYKKENPDFKSNDKDWEESWKAVQQENPIRISRRKKKRMVVK